MNKSVTSFVTIAGEILEQNVSIIEKIESKIKISRFISRNLFLGVSIAFIIGYIYIFERYIPDYYVLGFLVPLVFLVLFMLIINKTLKTSTGTKKLLIDKIFIYAYSSSLETIIIFAFYYFVKVYMKIGLYAFIIEYYPSLLFILPLFVLTYGLFHSCKDVSEQIVRLFLNVDYEVVLLLNNRETIMGKLKTITKKGDYVLHVNGDDTETLIKNSSISTIRLYNTEE